MSLDLSKNLFHFLKESPRITVRQAQGIRAAANQLKEVNEANDGWGREAVELGDFLLSQGVKLPLNKCIMKVAQEHIQSLQRIIDSKLHKRGCHDCGVVFYATDGTIPECLCPTCGSADTRRMTQDGNN